MEVKLLTRNFENPESWTLAAYEKAGGYRTFPKALAMDPEAVIQLVKDSGLRGRGGAGFPTGMKWGFVPKGTEKPKYLCVNADESEPGTFKDRYLLEKDPHALIEGIIITCWAVGIHHAYVYIRGEFGLPYYRLRDAVQEAYDKGYLGTNVGGKGFQLDITIHRGAGAYICGEETGLIESLEGKKGQPRLKPPFPAVIGVFGCPTVVNNVETIQAVTWILEHGAAEYKKYGTEKSPGTKLFSVSGHVNRPGVFEIPLGLPCKTLVHDLCGGIRNGKRQKANIVGGSSVPVLTGEEADQVDLDYESLAAAGTMLGSGGMIVMDEDTCMVWTLAVILKFYAHESCGQCTPCREGTGWIRNLVYRLEAGGGTAQDLDKLLSITKNMMGTTICVLADAAAMPTESFLKKFRREFEAHAGAGRCPIRGASSHFLTAAH
ncbi:MAG: NADH-quinone oxidoreductase subunit NuoF [Candidatus Eisenbacteria bacterium]|uniref:NADH-quinone oxidoreductase subunit F n=1 Tax=Eiseniibacteriota bacterium TaxID=2212470 RepID=A0A956M356_UNCEI|nr:NADH-quinone oxidoreductase subunit NuoF [Candidatus Eisenbacteria bacterium]